MSPWDRPHRNTYWVLSDRLLAGEYPGADDPEETHEKLDSFLASGFTRFLDLTEPHEKPPYDALLLELASKRALNVMHRRHPIPDVSVPTDRQHMTAILRQIDEWLGDEHRVYVHCRGGIGRTGMVIGCYLVQSGHDGEGALRRLQELWATVGEAKRWCFPRIPQTVEQENYIRNWRTDGVSG
ncbi:protein-tyrosine phosphatase family protein [Methylococcus geothermalis]|nr:protein-tyrosine phosphatase family protein [Methylococcus geothermalis]